MENTTNINDLPVDTNAPNSYDLPENQLRPTREIDEDVIIPETRRVHFEDTKRSAPSNYELRENHKVIVLAILFFIIFSDIKVKNYLVSILVVIFGEFIRITGGGISKIGLVIYALFYGLALFITVSLIDLSSFKLAF